MKAVKLPLNVKVTYGTGAYNTANVIGQRASSTSSAEAAMTRLVEKLHQRLQLLPGTLEAAPLAAKGLKPGVSMWLIDVAAGHDVGDESIHHHSRGGDLG